MKLLSRPEYERELAKTRDERMKWWREARFGMFVHYGLYSVLGRHEWTQVLENYEVEEYAKIANQFKPDKNAPYEWAKLAKAAGMKYMVMTTRHHEGFSLWDSKVNPFNSVNFGGVDVVKEFVNACRENDLGIGFYSSLMDWRHPDSYTASYDSKARQRFNDYILELNTELLSNYGKIDILWYDVSNPMEHAEGWNSLEINQKLRALQPNIIINNRSKLDEDFGTPEGHVTPEADKDWEACMTFNDISWGYVDEEQALQYSYNAPRILKMLSTACANSGNLLLNVGPKPDGSLPKDAIEPLTNVGKWVEQNKETVYGIKKTKMSGWGGTGNATPVIDGNVVYLWNWIWNPDNYYIGYFIGKLKKASFLADGTNIEFEQINPYRIKLLNLPKMPPDLKCGVSVIKLEFEEAPITKNCTNYPQLWLGEDITKEYK